MSKYICSRCNYSSNNKLNFIRHLQRKNICNPVNENIEIQEIYNKYFKKSDNKVPSILLQKPSISLQKPSISLQNPPKPSEICESCSAVFTRKDNLKRHYKRCKVKKKEYKNMKELVDLLNDQIKGNNQITKKKDKQIVKQQKQIELLMKKNGMTQINNIQNNIKLLSYHDTDISHLTNADYKACLNRANFCVPHIIKKIHFNPKKPENHNIYISNIKNSYVMVYKDKKWDISDKNEFIEDIIEEKTNLLEDKLSEWEEKGKNYPLLIKKFNRYLEKREIPIVKTKIKLDIKFILFNNRHFILG